MPFYLPNTKLRRLPDPKYPLWLNTELKVARIIKPKTTPLQVWKDMWLPELDKEYVENCLHERLRRSNWVNRVVYYVILTNGHEGFVPVPKYHPSMIQPKDSNPYIYFIYRVNNHGIFYFK